MSEPQGIEAGEIDRRGLRAVGVAGPLMVPTLAEVHARFVTLWPQRSVSVDPRADSEPARRGPNPAAGDRHALGTTV
ncbi:hypothetical protein [Mycobacterium hubeiense]|uniref:hypothetical protein n=1 Tax=Mycobacterium hubeiense TaxID=1867256 RepID=UPI000C7F5AE0|nr:hypothetical protein [Mycobacterium sp. QGD 101]